MIILRLWGSTTSGCSGSFHSSTTSYFQRGLSMSSSSFLCKCSYQLQRNLSFSYFNWRKRPWMMVSSSPPNSSSFSCTVHTSSNSPSMCFSTCSRLTGRKKDYYAEEKLPIYDFGKIHPENKRVYVFGQAGHGGLGLHTLFQVSLPPGETVDSRKHLHMRRPVRHAFAGSHKVKDIATGHGFTLFQVKPKYDTGDPVIFGCGYNHKSQLGFQPDVQDKPLIVLTSVVPLALPLDKSSNVLCIGAGRAHSVISVGGKGLITLGDNGEGQCGRKVIGDEEYKGSKYIYRLSPFAEGDDVIQLACKFDLSLCLTKSGKVYTFGCNNQGQLGRGKVVEKTWRPAEIQGDLKGVKITKVTTNGTSCMAISDRGELFGWGNNDCGQVNPEMISNVYFEPRKVKVPRRVGKIIDVAIGDMFTFVLNEYGNVYVWGTGLSLGMGPQNMVIKSPTLMPPPLFGRNEFSPDTAVVKIEASMRYAAAVNSLGDLYVWGLNDSGCLGLGPTGPKEGNYQHFPIKVALGAAVHKVCLGADHTVVMTKGSY